MRILTCTPIRFPGNPAFFARDSGLLCRGLQEIGIGSKVVMPGPLMEDDEPDLIRTSYPNLQDSSWWKDQTVDAVVFYAWGDPKYAPITKAIKASGARVLLNMDTNGVFSPVPDPLVYYRQTFRRVCRMHGALAGAVIGFMKCLRASLPWEMDFPRIRHLEMADAISAVSPGALDLMVRHLRAYGRGNLAERIHFLPHPVSRQFHYDGTRKENLIVAVGRWTRKDQWQKDPALLIRSLALFLSQRSDYTAVVVGPNDELLHGELKRFGSGVRDRISVTGTLPNDEIADLLRRSRISLCSSFHESFHIASAEALCSGVSVVAPQAPSLTSFPFFVANGCGELADAPTAASLAETMKREAVRWDSGDRDPNHISGIWTSLVHAPKVATRVVEVLGMRS